MKANSAVSTPDNALSTYQKKMRESYLDHLESFISWNKNNIVLIVEPSKKTAEDRLKDKVGKVYTIPTEEFSTAIPEEEWTHLILWGVSQRIECLEKALQRFAASSPQAASVICLDTFVPEPARDWWSWASWVKDPSTIAHRTYHEYIQAFRNAGFSPVTMIPFRHRMNLEEWIDSADKRSESLQSIFKERIMKAPQRIKDSLHFELIYGEYFFTYDTFLMAALRSESTGATQEIR